MNSPRALCARSLILLAVCATATAACRGRDDARRADVFDVDDATPLQAQEDLRIGSIDDPDVGFSRVRGIEVAPDGMLYVLEDQQKEIRVYDPAGTLVRTIGQRGSGPGELEGPVAFGVLGDTLWVNDVPNQRITLFSTTGELLGTVPTQGVSSTVAGTMVRVMPFAPRGDGTYRSFIASMRLPGGTALDTFSTPRLIFNDAGEVVDSAGWHLNRPSIGSPITIGDRRIGMQHPLPDTPLRRTQDADTFVIERFAATEAGKSEFVVAKFAADTIYRRTFTYTPDPVPGDLLIETVRERLGSSPAPVTDGEIAAAVDGLFTMPEFHPPITDAHVGEDGSLWLQRHDDGTGHSRWLLLEPDGTLRGEVLLPRDATLEWARTDAALVIERDEFDVPWVVRYSIASM